jgi:hypothetical protein
MGARCNLDMENIITTSMEDLTPKEHPKYEALK